MKIITNEQIASLGITPEQFAEIGDVLSGKNEGRSFDNERILSYNIGLGLHDVLYAAKIYNLLNHSSLFGWG